MAMRAWKVKSSDRFYGALLWLYPLGFRARFGSEMMQVFRYCRREETGDDSHGRYFAFWLRTFNDLALSLLAAWQRELFQFTQMDFAVWDLVDSIAVPMIVIVLHLVAGCAWAFLTRGVTEPAKMPASHGLWNLGPLIAVGIAGCALGIAVVLSAFVVARINQAERPWIKL
jgi:hypothetical protein